MCIKLCFIVQDGISHTIHPGSVCSVGLPDIFQVLPVLDHFCNSCIPMQLLMHSSLCRIWCGHCLQQKRTKNRRFVINVARVEKKQCLLMPRVYMYLFLAVLVVSHDDLLSSRRKSSDMITVTLLDIFEEETHLCDSSRKCLALTEESSVCNNALFSKHAGEDKLAPSFYHGMLYFITVKN